MKINENYLLRTVAGQNLVVPVGAGMNFNAAISLNETGAFLWRLLENGATEDSLTQAVLAEYTVSAEVAKADVTAFLNKLRDNGILDEN